MARIYNNSLRNGSAYGVSPKIAASAAALLLAGLLCAQAPARLGELEKKADDEFSRRDCASASATYEQALTAAARGGDSSHVDFFWRRIGICRAREGDLTGALEAYRSGAAASESSG